MTNVIQFPKPKRGAPPQSLEEIQSEIEMSRQIHIDDTLSGVSEIFLTSLELNGFALELDNEKYSKEVALVFESIRSLLYKYYDMEYPFQSLSQRIFTLQENGYVLYSGDDVQKLASANTT